MRISNYGFRICLALLTAYCLLPTAFSQGNSARYIRRGNGAPSGTCWVGFTATEVYIDSATGSQYNCKSSDGNPSATGSWVLVATGTGASSDVTGPGSSTDEAVVRFNGTTGKQLQNSTVTITDAGRMAGATVDDPTTAQQPASKNYVDSAVGSAIGSGPQLNGLVSGGVVTWESAYTFRVSAATYYIAGILYSSIEQTITLDAAHATLDRIDVLALNISGTLVKITGTAAAQPSEPDYDPTTQLKLTFVLVTANTTEPVGVSNENVYLENTEWTSSTSGSGWNANSTNNPRNGLKDIEGTNVANAAYVQLQRSSPTTLDSYATLVLFIRSKATWNANRILRVQFFSAGVAKGNSLTIATGFWGFDSSITSGYQLVAIPLPQFALPVGTSINQLRITDVGGAIGFYIDDVVLQAQGSGIGQVQGDARYLQRANNLSDVASASAARLNIGAASGTGTAGNLVQITNSTGPVIGNAPAATDGTNVRVTGRFCYDASFTVCDIAGTGDPETVVSAAVGSLYHRTDGAANSSLYRKETGSGNAGWVAIANPSGPPVVPAGYTMTAFINAFYSGAFARSPTGGELTADLATLEGACTNTPQALAFRIAAVAYGAAFYNSAEYISRGRTDAEFVDDLYAGFLGRDPDTLGNTFWLNVLGTETRAYVINRFANSIEYFNLRLVPLCFSSLLAADAITLWGRDLSSAAPTDGQVLLWDNAAQTWKPGAAAASGPASGLTMSTNRLLGRTTASSGAVEEITVGSGLSLSAGTLTASGGTFAGGGFEQWKVLGLEVNGSAQSQIGIAATIGEYSPGGAAFVPDSDSHWRTLNTDTSANTDGGFDYNTGDLVYPGHLPQAFHKMKTWSVITSMRYWIGFFTASPMTSSDPTTHAIAFSYDTGADGSVVWYTYTNDNSGGGTRTATAVTVSTSTIYVFAIVVKASSVDFYISTDLGATYALVNTHTTNLPASSATMNWYSVVRTLNTTQKKYYHSYTIIRQH